MGIESISSMSMAASSMQVPSLSGVLNSALSPETIRKLKELGLDPSLVKSEAEAQALIAKAESQKAVKNQEQAQTKTTGETDVKMQSMDTKMKEFTKRVQDMAYKLGVQISAFDNPNNMIDKLDAKIKELDTKNNANAVVDATSSKKDGVDVNKVKFDMDELKAMLYEMNKEKDSAYAGQDMLAMMNKLALGI